MDFAPLLGCGERIVEVAFSTDGGAIAWASIFGTLATAWIAWLSPGQQSAEVTALTSSGATLTGTVTVTVSGTGALLQARRQASLPDGTGVPPNAALAPDKTVLSLDAGHTWQVSLSDLLSPAGQPLLSPSGVRLRDQVFETRTNILLIA
ncbi:hypothetical protein GMO_11370 [Gluconobacter morbifer G707]|uniref:Uncharacterized protein n=1 Tax=Gluconobacter morbifer G707 TaxID=1088869 RepID=G6XIQ9_9PROT|nr:hypothetical protein GMO_11370 [Gluconobacter morbifer G707]